MGETYETGGIAMSMNLKSDFSIPRALQTTGIVWLLTTLVGLYPAWRVSKLQPAEALRRR